MKANAESCKHDFRASEVQAPGYCPRCDRPMFEYAIGPWRERIEALEREACEARDTEQADLCAAALFGNPHALVKCQEVILEAAQAMAAEAADPADWELARQVRDWFRDGGLCPQGVDPEEAERVFHQALREGFSPGSASVKRIREMLTGTEVTA